MGLSREQTEGRGGGEGGGGNKKAWRGKLKADKLESLPLWCK